MAEYDFRILQPSEFECFSRDLLEARADDDDFDYNSWIEDREKADAQIDEMFGALRAYG